MRLFKCAVCAQLLYFENTRCEKCGHVLGYEPDQNRLLPLKPEGTQWRSASGQEAPYKFCINNSHGVCNWLIAADSADGFCVACRHNGMIPDLSQSRNVVNWQKIEAAKHRLFYTLLRLKLPLRTRDRDPQGLLFNFLADPPFDSGKRVMTGHDSGLITLSISEAEDSERERRRSIMGEPYRTLLGHFRHEVGHYFWDRLVRDRNDQASFRNVFGDETVDYQRGLDNYYRWGAPGDWQNNYVSAYATSHPWEDFAETWAHYLHILDTMEMARAFNLHVAPRLDDTGALEALIDFDPYQLEDFAAIVDNWLPISFAMNNLNRCMGQPDLYPFVLSPAVIDKLSFVHRLVGTRSAGPPGDASTHRPLKKAI
ncbi:MAG: putative zinc-binding metallopeptidase [Xanthobacteraceae bacterium]